MLIAVPRVVLQYRHWIAAFFESASCDADSVGGFELAPDFLGRYIAGKKRAVEADD